MTWARKPVVIARPGKSLYGDFVMYTAKQCRDRAEELRVVIPLLLTFKCQSEATFIAEIWDRLAAEKEARLKQRLEIREGLNDGSSGGLGREGAESVALD
jgi:hypothetical protein